MLIVAALVKFVPSRYFEWCRFQEEPPEDDDAFDLNEFYKLKPNAQQKLLRNAPTGDASG